METNSSRAKLHIDDDDMQFKSTNRTCLIWILVAVLALATISLIIAVSILASKQKEMSSAEKVTGENDQDICMSPGCVQAAAMVLDNLDTSVSPCEDFYQFSCGGWEKRSIIPDDSSSYSTFAKLRDQLSVHLKELLEQKHNGTRDADCIGEAKTLYRACINEDAIEARGAAPLRDFITALGGWPIADNAWSNATFDLVELVAKLRIYNNRVLVDMWVSADDRNSSLNVIQFDQAPLGLPGRDYYIDPTEPYKKFRSAYHTFLVETVKLLASETNGTIDISTVKSDADDVIAFETFLANISLSEVERRETEKTYRNMTLAEMSAIGADQLNWTRFVEIVYRNFSQDIVIQQSERVVVYGSNYLNQLAARLKVTPARVLANLLVWRITKNRISNLPKSFQELEKNFNKVLYGIQSEQPTWKKCGNLVNSFMGMAVGKLFVDKYFDEDAKADALSMIAGVRQSFDYLLENVKWMDDATREIAKVKSSAIQQKIGYPDWFSNRTKLDAEYEGLDSVTEAEYFTSIMTLMRWTTRKTALLLRQEVEKDQWSTTPAVVNAYYSPSRNQIAFPAGILQPPFWQRDRPVSMNFGGIGMVIGHEITHGFDDQGRQYDKDGNMVEWWKPSVIAEFKKKAACIISQYGNYTMEQVNMTLNGQQTQGENIADNGGIKQAYHAFSRSEQQSPGQRLPGLQQYSPNQLFFISFAQIWCGTYRDQAVISSIRTGVHSPGRFRVIGPLSNFPEFSSAFQCAKGTRMNPDNKCSVW